MRKLKYHESKLLKRVDFLNWSHENNLREVHVLRRYLIQDREDYHSYNKLVGLVTKLVTLLKKLDELDAKPRTLSVAASPVAITMVTVSRVR